MTKIRRFVADNPLLIIILLFALWDIRTEVFLLANDFTFIGLFYAVTHHPFSTFIIISLPWIKH